jgi:hypothetical protein
MPVSVGVLLVVVQLQLLYAPCHYSKLSLLLIAIILYIVLLLLIVHLSGLIILEHLSLLSVQFCQFAAILRAILGLSSKLSSADVESVRSQVSPSPRT